MSDNDAFDLAELAGTHPRTTSMAALAGGTLAWYALPDLVRWRGVRAVLKTGILAGMVGAIAGAGPHHHTPLDAASSDRGDELIATVRKYPTATVVAVGATAATLWASVRAEQWLFRRGERRRSRGHVLPHLRQAVPLALVVAVGLLVDPGAEPAQ